MFFRLLSQDLFAKADGDPAMGLLQLLGGALCPLQPGTARIDTPGLVLRIPADFFLKASLTCGEETAMMS